MASLLNRLIWVLSIFIVVSLTLIDIEYFFSGLVLALIFRFLLFSRENVESAVAEMLSSSSSFSEDVLPTKDSSFSSQEVPSPESLDPKDATPFLTHVDTVTQSEDRVINLPQTPIKTEPSAFSLWIHEFFSDRPLAKVGGILLFLGALFFLWLIFDTVGPVGKVIIGLAFGFFLIFCGVWLDKKGSSTESRVLFGIGIAVNYLTILAGRHILGNVSSIAGTTPLFSDIFATIALLLNTFFAVAISIAYASSTLLAFAFITAYCIPFIVGSETSSILLLSLYTTLITFAIVGINFVFLTREREIHLTRGLSLISIIGMTCLFSLASLDASGGEYYAIGIGMFLSITVLFALAYKMKESILPILSGGYMILLVMIFSGGSFFITMYTLIGLLLFCLFALSRGILLVGSMAFFVGFSFLMSLFGFWMDGSEYILLLLFLGMGISVLAGISTLLTTSFLLSLVSVIGFGCFLFLGIFPLHSVVIFDPVVIMVTKLLTLWLLIGGSFLSMRSANALVYFLSIVLSGFILIYPNTFETAPFLTILTSVFYTILSLVVPVFFFHRKDIAQKTLVLASLPVSALVGVYMIYQSVGDGYLSGIATGGLYIIQALVYLLYAVFIKSKIASERVISTLELPEKNILLILLAIPLSLFTFSLAFLFREIPGIMGLAWVIESSVLYMVAEKMHERKIFLFASFLFAIGIVKEFTLIGNITIGDWMSFGILLLMLISVLASLIILRFHTSRERVVYDILHIVSILCIGVGISRIIPSTGTGWSIFGPILFIFILTLLYTRVSSPILRGFQVFLILSVGFFFLGRFDSLVKEFPFLLIQWGALGLFLSISFITYGKHTFADIASLIISLIGSLLISSLYVSYFFSTFAVSIYLTSVATVLIILGIRQDTSRLRTIGLYIGLCVLVKIFFYDIWYGNQGMITRVVALMITGGIMIYLSQLYAKYVSHSWSDELSFSNIFGRTKEISSETDPFRGEVATDLQNIDVSHISRAVFRSEAGEFTLKRVSVLRLAQRIIDAKGKNTFVPGELESVYKFVLKNLESAMPKKDLEELLTNISIWIEKGGTIDLIKK